MRELRRENFYDNLPKLHEIAQDAKTSASDRLRAIDLQAKYGLGALQDVGIESVTAKLERTIREIESVVPNEIAGPLLERLRAVWGDR